MPIQMSIQMSTQMSLQVGAMRSGFTFEKILHIEHAGPIIMNVFVKGNAGGLFDRVHRNAINEQLADDLDIPFMPRTWKLHAAAKVMDIIASMLERAIMDTYDEALRHVEIATERELSASAAARAALRARQAIELAASHEATAALHAAEAEKHKAAGLANAEEEAASVAKESAAVHREAQAASEAAAAAAAAAELKAKYAHEAEEVVAAEASLPFDMRV